MQKLTSRVSKIGFCLALLLASPARSATLEDLYWVDLGVGFPQLASLEIALFPLRRWQFGVSYGVIPGGGQGGSISPSYALPSQNITLDTGTHITIFEPTITATFNSLCPFVRFFPKDNGFYLQLLLGMLRTHNVLTSEVHDVLGNKIEGASYGGSVDVTQLLPSISIGHIFNSELFFFSLNMGVTLVASVSSQANLTATLPDALGGSAANQSALDEVNQRNDSLLQQASDEFRSQVKVLPSIQLVFGISF